MSTHLILISPLKRPTVQGQPHKVGMHRLHLDSHHGSREKAELVITATATSGKQIPLDGVVVASCPRILSYGQGQTEQGDWLARSRQGKVTIHPLRVPLYPFFGGGVLCFVFGLFIITVDHSCREKGSLRTTLTSGSISTGCGRSMETNLQSQKDCLIARSWC
ncbi:hypothetical protein BD289DRAFT_443415 [Coniella lustricola]|uniref:Uncharacterized protein n=1 Tax=Coniella lustricola TaxID=2025994 RepID=A0A2T2ZX25_9PEZI|nr:hypothetical protein BD289DRAFT_443415 [Coniella lustricola]